MKNYLKNKKGTAVNTAIKTLTSVVCGALVLTCIFSMHSNIIGPKTKNKVDSMYEIKMETNGGNSFNGETNNGDSSNLSNLNPGKDTFVIPKTAVYKNSAGVKLAEFPAKPTSGDVYEEGNQEYTFIEDAHNLKNKSLKMNRSIMPLSKEYISDNSGWKFICNDKNIVNAQPIKETINGKPVIDISYAFENCEKLEKAPNIPKSVINMEGVFKNCTSLKYVPEIIPEHVKNMKESFRECHNIEGKIEINGTIENFNDCFFQAGKAKNTIILSSKNPGKINMLENISNTNIGFLSLTGFSPFDNLYYVTVSPDYIKSN